MPLIQLTDKIPAETIAKARREAKELLSHDFTIAFPEAANQAGYRSAILPGY